MKSENSSDRTRWPFVVIRHPMSVNDKPEEFERLIACHKRHPGAVDEFWFATGSRKTIPNLEKEVATFARYGTLCEEAGILPGYQQGLTLGHGEAHDGKPKPGEQFFGEDAWQRGRDGALIPFLCPRSPEVLAYEREYAEAVLRVAAPSSFWVDDDLRLGISKPEGCFCERCLAAFSKRTGREWKREELVARLFDPAVPRDPVRAEWTRFNAESLAVYAAAVRAAADSLGSSCRLAYQSVSADRSYTADNYEPLLLALSGSGGASVGIRPGHGFYNEAEPRGMVRKCLAVAREAERSRDSAAPLASICYEQETYPRHLLQKSPGAVMVECALALASGCNSLSLYWFPGESLLPEKEYDRALDALSGARPYFERLAASTRRTRLGGLARLVGSAAAQTADFDLFDETDFHLACSGVPVTVDNPAAAALYVDDKSSREMADSGEAALRGAPIVDVSDCGRFPLVARRARLLDELDAATGGAFPVRVDAPRALRILPRVREDGALDSVTLLNLSIGDTDALDVRLRRPASARVFWQGPKDAAPVPLATSPGATPGEIVAHLTNLGPWQIGTIFLGGEDATDGAGGDGSAAAAWRVYDGRELPLEGRGWPAERLETPWQRLPRSAHDALPEAVLGLQRNSAGMCYRFVTDSSRLRIAWRCTDPVCKMWNLASSGADGVDVYQRGTDGVWHFVRPPFPITPQNTGAAYIWDIEPGLPTAVYLPTYNGIAEISLGVESGREIRPAPPHARGRGKPVVFYGTSITQGASAAHPGGAWVAQAARIADVEAVNLGFSGSGKMEDSLLDCISEIDAALYVLDTVSNMAPALIDERMERFVRILAQRRPGVPILLTANRTVMGDAARARDAAVRAVYDKLNAEDPAAWSRLYFAGDDAAALAPDSDGTEDGLHFNDIGMKRAGEYFGRVISEILA